MSLDVGHIGCIKPSTSGCYQRWVVAVGEVVQLLMDSCLSLHCWGYTFTFNSFSDRIRLIPVDITPVLAAPVFGLQRNVLLITLLVVRGSSIILIIIFFRHRAILPCLCRRSCLHCLVGQFYSDGLHNPVFFCPARSRPRHAISIFCTRKMSSICSKQK